jgi:HAD superfamily hydrolase (TIGR01509 family)
MTLSRTELQAMPGLHSSLAFFERKGFRIGLATSGSREQVELVFDRFGIGKYFDAVLTKDDIKHGKPHPEIYLNISALLELEPVQCVVLEDARSGVEAGNAAGCYTIAIINKSNPPQDLSMADAVFDSLDKVTKLPFISAVRD